MEMRSLEDIKEHNGEIVHVEGIYQASELAQWPQEGQHTGRYCIQVGDDLQVLLLPPYRPESIRPEEEVAQYEGRRVRVTGVIREKTYMEMPTLEHEPLAVSVPCFSEISSIELMAD